MQELFPVDRKKRTANAVRNGFPPVGNAVPGVPAGASQRFGDVRNAGDGVPYVQVSFCLQ